jgi:hypothetical protein
VWQAEVELRRALGLPFPHANHVGAKPDESSEEGRPAC